MDSVQEQIIKKIVVAMTGIPGVNSVQRHEASGVDLGNMPTILVREGDCGVELTQSSHQFIRRRLEVYFVIANGIDEAAEARSGSEVMNAFIAEIEKAIGADERWGGLALMTAPPEYLTMEIDAETPHLARGLRTEITYEHERGNPWG